MLRGSKGPVIQIDRLIFDTRNNMNKNLIIPNRSPSLNKTNQEGIISESHILIPSDKIEIIRLTLEDLNKDEKKIYTIGQQSSSILPKRIDEDILSPVYESIDGIRDTFDLIKNGNQFEKLC